MNKIWVITKREFLTNVLRWQFWVYTLFLPVVIVVILLGSLLVSAFVGISVFSEDEEEKEAPIPYVIGVVDPAEVLDTEALNLERDEELNKEEPGKFEEFLQYIEIPGFLQDVLDEEAAESKQNRVGPEYRDFASWEEGLAALEARELRGLLEFPQTYKTDFQGRIRWYDKDNRISLRKVRVKIRKHILSPFVGEDMIENVLDPLDSLATAYHKEEKKKDKQEKEEEDDDMSLTVQSLILALIYMGAMLVVITASSDRLLRGLAEEKQNRVIETLLSSVTSDQLMAGKVLGLGGASLMQFVIWFGSSFIPIMYLVTFIKFDPLVLLVFMGFMTLGYLINAVSILGLGSLGNNIQEASQWASVFIIANMVPFFCIPFLMIAPDGMAAIILTYVPVTAPMVVMFRIGAETIPMWEVGLSFLVLLISTVLALRFSSKLFRMGLLMTGQKPTPKTIWRMWRVS